MLARLSRAAWLNIVSLVLAGSQANGSLGTLGRDEVTCQPLSLGRHLKKVHAFSFGVRRLRWCWGGVLGDRSTFQMLAIDAPVVGSSLAYLRK